MDLLDTQLYGMIGDEGFTRLVTAFYRRVPDDDILGPLYPKGDWAGAEERLRLFLVMRFGGPRDYLARRGPPALRMRHARFRIDPAARDRWVSLMEQAMAEVGFAPAAAALLQRFFEDAATFLINLPAARASSANS